MILEFGSSASGIEQSTSVGSLSMKAQIVILKDWRNARRAALEQWRVDKSTVFPRGAWMHVVVHGAAAA